MENEEGTVQYKVDTVTGPSVLNVLQERDFS